MAARAKRQGYGSSLRRLLDCRASPGVSRQCSTPGHRPSYRHRSPGLTGHDGQAAVQQGNRATGNKSRLFQQHVCAALADHDACRIGVG